MNIRRVSCTSVMSSHTPMSEPKRHQTGHADAVVTIVAIAFLMLPKTVVLPCLPLLPLYCCEICH